MRIGRTLPPAAAPIQFPDLWRGLAGWFQGEATIKRFEEELKRYFAVRHCFLTGSGKAALLLILEALKAMYPQRDEVVVPAFTCYSVPAAIVRAGLKVRAVEMDGATLDFDFAQLRRHLDSRRLLCVIPGHLFGWPADIVRLRSMISDPHVTIVEDAAQAMGGQWQGRQLGTLGDVGFFSLGRGKALSTVEGGIVITRRDDIGASLHNSYAQWRPYRGAELVQLLGGAVALALLIRPRWFWIPRALPFLKLGTTVFDPNFKVRRLSAFQAGLAGDWPKKIAAFKAARAENYRYFAAQLNSNFPARAGHCVTEMPDLLRLPWKIEAATERERLLERSARLGLGIAATYPGSVDQIAQLKSRQPTEECPVAQTLARQLLSVPIHPLLNCRDRENIRRLIGESGASR